MPKGQEVRDWKWWFVWRGEGWDDELRPRV